MDREFYDERTENRPRTKISQFARSDFLNPTSKVRVELFPVSIYVFNHSNPKIDCVRLSRYHLTIQIFYLTFLKVHHKESYKVLIKG